MRRVVRAQRDDLDGQVLDELLELLVAGDEVGLAVDLDERAEPAARVDVAADQALAGVAAGLLGRLRRRRARAAGRSPSRGRRRISVEGLLAIHEPGAGPLAQFLDQLGRDVRHRCLSLLCCRRAVGRTPRGGFRRSGATGSRPGPPGDVRRASRPRRRPRPSRPPRARARRRCPPGEASAAASTGTSATAAGRPVARQQVVVLVDVRLEGERRATGEGRDELVGRARLLVLGLGHRDGLDDLRLARGARGTLAGRPRWPRRRRARTAAGSRGSRRRWRG